MKRLIKMFEKQSTLKEIENAFNFLITDFGFKLLKRETRLDLKAKNFLVYSNEISKLQIEICGDSRWFHCEIRRIINGQAAKYNDKTNCISFTDLAILESNYNNELLDFYSVIATGLHGILKNTTNLFKRYKKFLTTDQWIDVKKIEQLKDDGLEKIIGIRPSNNIPTFDEELKNQATKLFREKGYELLVDSDELSPFDRSGMVNYFTFSKDSKQIKVTQNDWRDLYYIYRIELNGNNVFEIDISNQDINKSIDSILKKLLAIL